MEHKNQIYHEASQKLLGGGLNGGDEGRHSLDSPFTADLSLEDPFANDHQRGVGASQHQGVDENLADKKNRIHNYVIQFSSNVRWNLLGGGPFLVLPDLVDESHQLTVVERGQSPSEHVDLVGGVLCGWVDVVRFGFNVADDFGQQTESLLLEDLSLDFHDHGRVDIAESGLAHQGSVGLVIIIIGVSEGLVDVDIGGDAGNQLGVASGGGRLQSQVLDGQTFGGFSLVAEGLDDQLVNGLDALDDEVTLSGGTTDDADGVGVLNNQAKRQISLSFSYDMTVIKSTYRKLVLASGSVDQAALQTLVAVVVENGQNAAFVQIAVLHDLVDGEVLAELGGGQQPGLGFDNLSGQTADVVPGLALTSHGSLLNFKIGLILACFIESLYISLVYLHGVVDGVLSVVVVVFTLLEDTRGSIELELDLGSQSALEVNDPQGLFLANGDALDLAGDELDLERLLEEFLVDDADFLSGIDFGVLLHDIFVELLALGGEQLNL